jgi:hypothetical protein
MKNLILICLVSFSFYGCETTNNNNANQLYSSVWVPIYEQPNQTTTISYTTPDTAVNAGKIYVYGNYVLQNEMYKGFHIIDHSNPTNPIKIGFLKVNNATEIAIKNNVLYTNSLTDMLAINITNITQPTLIGKIPNAFPLIDQEYPPFSGVRFQCVDKSKGFVVRWEERSNITALCTR